MCIRDRYIPVDNADKRMRKVITQDEAQAVLDRVPEIEALAVNNEKERETRYKEAVRSCEPDSVISLLKCLHIRNEQRAQAGKKSTAVDEMCIRDRYYNRSGSRSGGYVLPCGSGYKKPVENRCKEAAIIGQ